MVTDLFRIRLKVNTLKVDNLKHQTTTVFPLSEFREYTLRWLLARLPLAIHVCDALDCYVDLVILCRCFNCIIQIITALVSVASPDVHCVIFGQFCCSVVVLDSAAC